MSLVVNNSAGLYNGEIIDLSRALIGKEASVWSETNGHSIPADGLFVKGGLARERKMVLYTSHALLTGKPYTPVMKPGAGSETLTVRAGRKRFVIDTQHLRPARTLSRRLPAPGFITGVLRGILSNSHERL
ncbi:hypothetical protein CCAX7_29490 [Capsulimonas corticalis]|uniref:Uncharacterized protein n=1 Tax=Capsulimonas corticalis TaxID=2219043 RepID=A0A402CT01_9BACT|nr:hypothetical protein CCAX7_29490 [Capsulimonas corticalis]